MSLFVGPTCTISGKTVSFRDCPTRFLNIFLVLKTKLGGTCLIDADVLKFLIWLSLFIINQPILFCILKNALEFSHISLNPLAV
jgi:hypothetical protein